MRLIIATMTTLAVSTYKASEFVFLKSLIKTQRNVFYDNRCKVTFLTGPNILVHHIMSPVDNRITLEGLVCKSSIEKNHSENFVE